MSNSTTSTPSYTELLSVIERQERVIAQQEQVIARQEATIKQLNGRIKELEHKVDELEEKVQHLEGELAKKDLRIEELVKQLYGKSSEKDKSKKCGGKRGTRAHSRDGFNDDNEHNNDYPDHLPRIEEFVDNLPDGANPDDYQLIGERRVPRLATLPVLHYVLVTIHRTYKKKSNSYIPPRKPEHEHPLGKCSADISFIACRRSNLVRWSERLADLLEIIAGAILQDIKGAAVVYGDESPAVVNIKKGEESSEYKRTYFWNLVAPDRGVFFHWTEKRNQKEAKQLLAGIQGTFVSDALEIYDHATSKLSLSWAICWIHIRRNFLKTTSNKELAEQALGRINTILAIDKAIRAATKNDSDIQRRLQYRQRFLSPLVDGMRQWICTHINTPAVQTDDLMLKAFNYIDRRWEEATCFIREPLVLPHNNIPEQHFRFLKIGAKNWLFCASECGAKTLTTLYTLLYSAKLLNINPSVYLNDIIKQIDVQGVTPNQLVPRVWKEHREKIATENYFKNHRQTANRTGNT